MRPDAPADAVGEVVWEVSVDSTSVRDLSRDMCPVTATLDAIGGKWKPLIVYYLLQGTCRFGELRRHIPTVTQQMLTLQLRELERDGLVHRQVYAQVPPKVEYSLTPLGTSLEPVVATMTDWGQRYLARVGTEGTGTGG